MCVPKNVKFYDIIGNIEKRLPMDEDIIQKAKNGDREAFELIFNEDLRKELYVLAMLKLNHEEDAKDAVQETVFEAFKSIKNLRENNKIKIWITKILMNKCNDILRYNKRVKVFSTKEINNYMNKDEVIYIDDDVTLFEMLGILEPLEKDIIFLYLKGYTSKEISSIINMNDNTVRTKIMRAKNNIRDYYTSGV